MDIDKIWFHITLWVIAVGFTAISIVGIHEYQMTQRKALEFGYQKASLPGQNNPEWVKTK